MASVVSRRLSSQERNAVHPLLVASIFVVTMASPAILAVRYTVKPRRETALGSGSAQRRLPHTVESSLAGSIPEYLSTIPGPRLLTPATHINQLEVHTSDPEEQDGSGIACEDRENAIELLAR
jgi:hypothetical protein